MTWEWVILILGLATLFCALLGFVTWTSAKTERFKAVPKTLPDMMTSQRKEDASP